MSGIQQLLLGGGMRPVSIFSSGAYDGNLNPSPATVTFPSNVPDGSIGLLWYCGVNNPPATPSGWTLQISTSYLVATGYTEYVRVWTKLLSSADSNATYSMPFLSGFGWATLQYVIVAPSSPATSLTVGDVSNTGAFTATNDQLTVSTVNATGQVGPLIALTAGINQKSPAINNGVQLTNTFYSDMFGKIYQSGQTDTNLSVNFLSYGGAGNLIWKLYIKANT